MQNSGFKSIYAASFKRILQISLVLATIKLATHVFLGWAVLNSSSILLNSLPIMVLLIAYNQLIKRRLKNASLIVMYTLPVVFAIIAITCKDVNAVLLIFALGMGAFIVFKRRQAILIYNFILLCIIIACQSLYYKQSGLGFNYTNIVGTAIFFSIQFFILLLARKFYFHILKLLSTENTSLNLINSDLLAAQKILIEKNNKLELSNHKEILTARKHTAEKLISIIAHDVKAPLITVKRVLEMSNNEKTKAEALLLLPEVEKTVASTVGLLDNLLDWAKQTLQKKSEAKSILPLNKLVLEALELYNLSVVDKKLNVSLELNPSSWVEFNADAIKTVMRNVINNLVKFSPVNGDVKIVLQRNGDRIKLLTYNEAFCVSDEQIRLLNCSKDQSVKNLQLESGSGVGLMLVKDILTANNATIQYSNNNNQYIVTELVFNASNIRVLTADINADTQQAFNQ